MNIVFVGPPGSGKGTQASRLSRRLHIPHIASGDLLRAVRVQETELGHETKRYMDAGQLVPDDLTVRILEERLERPDAAAGAILDGFPRTVAQARSLDASFASRGKRLEHVIYMQASRPVVLERMAGRWICPQCGTVYNIPNIAPHEKGHCDVCGTVLYQRHDEAPEIQSHRYDIYEQETLPIIAYYRSQGLLVEIDGEGTVESVGAAITEALSGVDDRDDDHRSERAADRG